jgi:hypothetical protein
MPGRLGRKSAIEPGPAVCVDLGGEAMADIQIISWSELKRDEVTRASTQPLADVIPRNDEVVPVVALSSDEHMV